MGFERVSGDPAFQVRGGAALNIMTLNAELSPGQHMATEQPVRACIASGLKVVSCGGIY